MITRELQTMNSASNSDDASRNHHHHHHRCNHPNINSINVDESVKLMIGVSCAVFDSYQNIPLTLSPAFIREVLNMESAEAGMTHLSRHVCTHAICTIYDDLMEQNNYAKIRQLLQKVQLFHIHGRTARDIIFPSHNDDAHAHHGSYVYVCTHC